MANYIVVPPQEPELINVTVGETVYNVEVIDNTEVVNITISSEQGVRGPQGLQGEAGLSAYLIALENGFVGTQEEWLRSLGETPYILVTGPMTLSPGKKYIVDNSLGPYSLILPVGLEGDPIEVWDLHGIWGTNNLTLIPSAGQKINGLLDNAGLVLDVSGAVVHLVYTTNTKGWQLDIGGIGADSLPVAWADNSIPWSKINKSGIVSWLPSIESGYTLAGYPSALQGDYIMLVDTVNNDVRSIPLSELFYIGIGVPPTTGMVLSSTNTGERSWINPPSLSIGTTTGSAADGKLLDDYLNRPSSFYAPTGFQNLPFGDSVYTGDLAVVTDTDGKKYFVVFSNINTGQWHTIMPVVELGTEVFNAEPALPSGLNAPTVDGQVLSSTIAGVRSWVSAATLGAPSITETLTEAPILAGGASPTVLDLSKGRAFKIAAEGVTSGTLTINIENEPEGLVMIAITIIITTGVLVPAIVWSSGVSAPALAANKEQWFTMTTIDGGLTWRTFAAGAF